MRNIPANASASAEGKLVGEAPPFDIRPEIDDIYLPPLSLTANTGCEYSWQRTKYARKKSSPSRTRFSGPTGGISTELSARQLPLLGFGWVGGSLLERLTVDMAARPSGKIAVTEREKSERYTGSVPAASWEPRRSLAAVTAVT